MRLGVVRFVNTLPLIDGLEHLRGVELVHAAPSELIGLLESGEIDIGLCSSVDAARTTCDVTILPVGLLGCSGPTLTVRLYARSPFDTLSSVACDVDSHTSVELLRVVLREQYGVEPELMPFDASVDSPGSLGDDGPEALLLIGDKVITAAPPEAIYPYQLDLGAAWYDLTSLPFSFALWIARSDVDPEIRAQAAAILDRTRRLNASRIGSIVHHRARHRDWPVDVATRYLREHIDYEYTAAHRQGYERFLELAGLRR